MTVSVNIVNCNTIEEILSALDQVWDKVIKEADKLQLDKDTESFLDSKDFKTLHLDVNGVATVNVKD